eukprot:COSAG05_NODE_3889_length_1787_cov_4.441351_1_plen_90_part_00
MWRSKEEKADDIRKVKGNDAGLEKVNWFHSGVTDAAVEGLAEALKGNTVVQTVDLSYNDGVTDASMAALKAGLKESGVVDLPPLCRDRA